MKVNFTRSFQNLIDEASVRCVGNGLDNHRMRFRFTAKELYRLLPKLLGRLWSSPSLVLNGYKDNSLGVKVAGAWTDHCSPSTPECKDGRSCNSLRPRAFLSRTWSFYNALSGTVKIWRQRFPFLDCGSSVRGFVRFYVEYCGYDYRILRHVVCSIWTDVLE